MFARCECGLLRGRRATQDVSPVTPCHNLGIIIIVVIIVIIVIIIIAIIIVVIGTIIIVNLSFVRLHGQTDQTEFDDLISALRYPPTTSCFYVLI